MRFLADIPDDDVEWLDRLAREQGKSRAALLREAVLSFRAEQSKDWLELGFGLWKDGAAFGDAVGWQRRERAGWTRPWDDDHEEVKTEFPDLFDGTDDRERAHYMALKKGKGDQERPGS